ncbi:SGNH/GDSL hydrolase family protein [Arenicella xantha]|uniref:Lysophospholipase L1-like esterase n=1 Tax=Arenicella xantha TaxID=644221 RepID=A0A395JK95_9GAMM|nr:SGNH/GDSL hydrolase family protein [Arenicella xantha]RBP49208.1 lysophospholipase L1-like esterase [Arenicella xantha]
MSKIAFPNYLPVLKKRRKPRSVIAGIVAALVGVQSTAALAAADDPTVIVLFGDSTTTGINANYNSETDRQGNGTITRGCPTIYLTNLLQNLDPIEPPQSCPTTIYNSPVFDANNEDRDVIVANWGWGGSDTDNGVSRIQSNLSSTKGSYAAKAYHVLIMYGTNDFNSSISTSTTRFNLRQMIQRARQVGYTPALGTLTPRDDRAIEPYNSAVSGAASDEGVPLINHYARFVAQSGGWRTLIPQEISSLTGELIRVHPNDHGYLVIAETWFDQYLKNIIDPEASFNVVPVISLLLSD